MCVCVHLCTCAPVSSVSHLEPLLPRPQPHATLARHARPRPPLAPDVSLGDVLLVDGGIISFRVVGKEGKDVEASRGASADAL